MYVLFHILKIVNDKVERGIKLIAEYNNQLTHNCEEKQFILNILQEYKKIHPNVNVKTN